MGVVTIEGSLAPAEELPRGVRRTVAVTDHVRRLVASGCAVVVAGSLNDDAPPVEKPVPAVEEHPEPSVDEAVVPHPGRNSSRDKWAEFLTSLDIEYSDEDSRDDLIALFDALADGE